MMFYGVIFIALFVSLVVQQFIPPLDFLHQARVLLMPIVLFYGAVALPFPWMLALAFCAGFMWDALTVQIVDSTVEISIGWSILLYAALGAIMSGLRPLFQKGRWEVHCLLSGVCTAFIVMAEYLMITFRRGDLLFPVEIWGRIWGAGLAAFCLSPVLFFIFNSIGRAVGYEPQPERKVVA